MANQDFLFELGIEELPSNSLQSLSQALAKDILAGLKELLGSAAQELLKDIQVERFAAPRRLAVRIKGLVEEVPSSETVVTGPPLTICYDADGNPTKALLGFAKKNGTSVEQLGELNGKVSFTQQQAAQPVAEQLPAIVEAALNKLPIAKRMRWGASRREFVRPVHWLVMLFGDKVINCEMLGLTAGKQTLGHRFHHNQWLEINSPADYEQQLRQAYVVADFNERRDSIEQQVLAEAAKIGGQPQIDADLLDEVTGLNEWPVALTGRFEERFLEVPQEALILSMKENQKYFYVTDEAGKLMPYFITIANIESKDPAVVIDGNEKVIRPRLADAAFFFETDKKTPLIERSEKLKSIVFQQQLGTVHQKGERIASLAASIAEQIGGDTTKAQRAGQLAKADLLTDMVFEFTELQGLMGYHYAQHDGEDDEVALAIYEQYLPKYAGDQLPSCKTGIALAIADRLDTLTGLFGINQPPTGSKDPFALRRASLGVLRIIIEHQLELDLQTLITKAVSLHNDLPAAATAAEQVLGFMLERLRALYEDQGIAVDTYLAVAALKPSKPLEFDQRVKAVEHLRQLPEAQALAAANKRVANILSKQAEDIAQTLDNSLLQEAAEKELAAALSQAQSTLEPLFQVGDYQQALNHLAGLQPVIDNFFDQVMVMADDSSVRANRLALLQQLRNLFIEVADISLLN